MKWSLIRMSFCLLLVYQLGAGQTRTYVNEFLNLGAGARGLAMGTAQVAVTDNATSGYWNPAGLTRLDAPQLSLMHAAYFSGIGNYDFASAAFPVSSQQAVLGFTLLRFAVDDIPNTLYLVNPDGSVNYDNVTTFSAADYAMLCSYARNIPLENNTDDDRVLQLGGNVKIIHRVVGSFASSWGFGLDAGLQYRMPHWMLGLMLKDITTTFNAWTFHFTDAEKQMLLLTQNDIPVKSTEITMPQLIPAMAWYTQIHQKWDMIITTDIVITTDGKRNTLISGKKISLDPRMGLELSYRQMIFVRAGISHLQRTQDDADTTGRHQIWISQPSVGAGFQIKGFQLSYAFTNLANQSQPLYSHIFSLDVDIPHKKKSSLY
ncbi:MAG: hypothetical protein IMW88_01765 [Thermoflavifilum sp.]|uniref:putative type IX sorting system protein PorV2 n=1 Tax=Thermoflavifilum sp. TaxID=1968839 RepID=UPI0018A5F4D8|nr:hypothetical protein [Thermoflavifilum sp.]QOR76318.1 MAG: hypothetical protein IMW88_01765 [Thermoflavifilum sp.]